MQGVAPAFYRREKVEKITATPGQDAGRMEADNKEAK